MKSTKSGKPIAIGGRPIGGSKQPDQLDYETLTGHVPAPGFHEAGVDQTYLVREEGGKRQIPPKTTR